MSNKIELKSIRELMGVNYFIPAYQRGYRWEKSQIEDLLNDIYSFANKKNKGEKEFYCLQPIVIKRLNNVELFDIKHLIDDNDWETFEVIDGQQRLTTMLILLKYIEEKHLIGSNFLNEYGFKMFNISYETRPELKSIFSELSVENNSNIDYDHITKSYQIIDNWFKKKEAQRSVRESILRTLVNSFKTKESEGVVQVIWYEVNDEETNPIETFLRINLGKIPLTNGELVKALFLQESLYGKGDLAELQQMEIAQKWDHIERYLQDKKFWWFISNEKYEGSTRIDYLLNIYYQIELSNDVNLKEITGEDKNQIFRFYNHQLEKDKSFDGVQSIWFKIENIFDQINEWYHDPKCYHYIGFLIYKKMSVLDIFNLIEEKEKDIKKILTKSDFTDLLSEKMSTFFSNVKKTKNIAEDIADKNEGEKEYLNISYKKDDSLVRDILLLYNLEYIVKHSEKNELIYKFPFHSFKNLKNDENEKISWDIEHIDSFTNNPLNKFKDQKIWLKNALVDIRQTLPESFIEKIEMYIEKEKETDEFESLYDEVKKNANEENNDDSLKNNIGNLTLLDSKTNRGYGNALFITKRRIIIEKDIKGTFIPQQTKNIFLKYTNVNNLKSHWTREDIELYNQDILRTLSAFI